MRYVLSLLLMAGLFPSAMAQNAKKNTMELASTVFDGKSLKSLLARNFLPTTTTKKERLISKHPISSLKFNWTVKDDGTAFSLFNLRVENIYIFQNDRGQFCTYLIMAVQPAEFDNFANVLGIPENATKAEYLSGDFDLLFWEKQGFQVFVNRHRALGDRTKNIYMVQILNMPYGELLDTTPIE